MCIRDSYQTYPQTGVVWVIGLLIPPFCEGNKRDSHDKKSSTLGDESPSIRDIIRIVGWGWDGEKSWSVRSWSRGWSVRSWSRGCDVVVLLLRCGRCVAGSPNPPQPKGPKREPTQQTHGGRTGHPPGDTPREGYCLLCMEQRDSMRGTRALWSLLHSQ